MSLGNSRRVGRQRPAEGRGGLPRIKRTSLKAVVPATQSDVERTDDLRKVALCQHRGNFDHSEQCARLPVFSGAHEQADVLVPAGVSAAVRPPHGAMRGRQRRAYSKSGCDQSSTSIPSSTTTIERAAWPTLAAPAGSALVASETAAWSWPPALARGSSITSALNASPVMAPHIHRENDIH